MCPFNAAAFPDRLATAREGQLTFSTIDGIPKLHIIRTIPLGEYARRICHQEQTRTFAICSLKGQSEKSEMHYIHLLDDRTFKVMCSHQLDPSECVCSILSCSFSDDTSVYYCVGTSKVLPDELEINKGRIHVFIVEDGNLRHIAKAETNGGVYSLNAFNGKLLAAINQKIQLYGWMLRDDNTRELQSECQHPGRVHAVDVKTRGDFIVVGDLMTSISLLLYKGGDRDFLFIVTERYRYCVLQWGASSSELVRRAMRDVSDHMRRPAKNGQICIIDPDCRLIGLHLYDGLFKVIPFDNEGRLEKAFNIRDELSYSRNFKCLISSFCLAVQYQQS